MNEKIEILKFFIINRYFKKFKNRKKLEKYQEKMILKHLKYLEENSKYFNNILKNTKIKNLDDLKKLPYMNKTIMMDNFNELNCVNIDKERALNLAINSEKTRKFEEKLNGISVGLSSGTSGNRGLFVVSDKERVQWAGGVLAKFLPKGNLIGHKIAFFLRADNNLYETVDSKFIKFKYFDIMKNMKINIKNLESYNPTVIIAPPSVLLLIADSILKKEIKINPLKIISVAEVLTDNDEKLLKEVFNMNIIHQAYQCTEGFLAHICEKGSFHINEDVVYIEKEYIDDTRFIPIVTDFIRKSQPIIRYRLNDILIEDIKKCECGSVNTVIKKIEGREDDIFVFYNENREKILVFPDFISRAIIYVKGIKNYKVIQELDDTITIYLDNITDEIKENIIKEFILLAKNMKFNLVKINFKKYTFDFTKKMKRVERIQNKK